MGTKSKLKISLTALIAVLVATVALTVLFWPQPTSKTAAALADSTTASSNVKVEEYLETIAISAKGGYNPAVSVAKANLPVVIQFNTDSTYDCSAVVAIPSINYRAHLPMTGSTTVSLPPQLPGSEITGTCGMGMYSFKIKFAG